MIKNVSVFHKILNSKFNKLHNGQIIKIKNCLLLMKMKLIIQIVGAKGNAEVGKILKSRLLQYFLLSVIVMKNLELMLMLMEPTLMELMLMESIQIIMGLKITLLYATMKK